MGEHERGHNVGDGWRDDVEPAGGEREHGLAEACRGAGVGDRGLGGKALGGDAGAGEADGAGGGVGARGVRRVGWTEGWRRRKIGASSSGASGACEAAEEAGAASVRNGNTDSLKVTCRNVMTRLVARS